MIGLLGHGFGKVAQTSACNHGWPMIRFTGQLVVDDPPAAVFELLADMAELDRWNPNARASRRISGDRFEPGSTYESAIAGGPIRMTAKSELVAVELFRIVQYEGSLKASIILSVIASH